MLPKRTPRALHHSPRCYQEGFKRAGLFPVERCPRRVHLAPRVADGCSRVKKGRGRAEAS
eukprot:1573421-Pyramimonas_sp.AAC.1